MEDLPIQKKETRVVVQLGLWLERVFYSGGCGKHGHGIAEVSGVDMVMEGGEKHGDCVAKVQVGGVNIVVVLERGVVNMVMMLHWWVGQAWGIIGDGVGNSRHVRKGTTLATQ